MQRKIKFLLLILFLIIAAVTAAAYLYSGKKTRLDIKPSLPLPTPKIPNPVGSVPGIRLNVEKKEFKFPNKLPFLKQSTVSSLAEPEIKQIASRLSFTNEPIIVNDVVDGKIYIWNNETDSLVITPNLGKIKLSPGFNPYEMITTSVNKQLGNDELVAITKDFLVNKIGTAKENIKHSSFVYLKTEKGIETFRETERGQAQIFQVNFVPSGSQYPIITLNPQNTPYSVQILRDGRILNAEIFLVGVFTEGLTEYKLKNYEEVISSLSKSVLISLNDGNVNLPDLTINSFKEVSVNSIEISYLLEKPTSESLQPIFILKGFAKTTLFDQNVSSVFYLPAFSENP